MMIWQLDDWVLCRIYNKKGVIEKYNNSNSISMEEKVLQFYETKPEIKTTMPPPSFSHDRLYMDTSDPVPRWHTDSSCSEHVLSPDATCDREVQSDPKWNELGLGVDDDTFNFGFNYMDSLSTDDLLAPPQFPEYQMNQQVSPLQDMFMYLQRSF